MEKQNLGPDKIVKAIMSASKKSVNALGFIPTDKIESILEQQGTAIDGYHNFLKQVDEYNQNWNASMLIKGNSFIYISKTNNSSNSKNVSLALDTKREAQESNSIPLNLEAGLSAKIFNSGTLDMFYIIIKKELCFKGNYELEAPIEISSEKRPDDSILYFLDDLFLHVGEYRTRGYNYDNLLSKRFEMFSSDLKSYVRFYHDNIILSSIGKTDGGELYITLKSPSTDNSKDRFTVPKKSKNDFDVKIYTN